MGVDTTIAVLYAQTGLGTQVAHAAAVAPHAQAAMTRVLALETAKQEQHLVEKTNKGEQKNVNKDGQHASSAPFGSRRRQRAETGQGRSAQNFDDYEGSLLNVTV